MALVGAAAAATGYRWILSRLKPLLHCFASRTGSTRIVRHHGV
ncbi:hypothetical protein ACFOPN_20065 [Xanthomonas hyacinthi]